MARIVVLQEMQANMNRVRRSLEPIGHVVIGFSSQSVAMAFLKDEKVDLIISAVHLDEGNVFDFLKWARSYPTNQTTPFIFFCAEPTQFGKHVFGAVKSAGELLGVSKYILMETFDTIQFRCEVAKLLAIKPTATVRKNGNESKTIKVPKSPTPDTRQLQDHCAVNPRPGHTGDGTSPESVMKDRKYQDHR